MGQPQIIWFKQAAKTVNWKWFRQCVGKLVTTPGLAPVLWRENTLEGIKRVLGIWCGCRDCSQAGCPLAMLSIGCTSPLKWRTGTEH